MRDFINRDLTIEGPREFLLNMFRWSYLDVDSDAAFERRIGAAIDNCETLTAHLHGQRPFTVTGVPTDWTATSTAGGPAHYTITLHRMPAVVTPQGFKIPTEATIAKTEQVYGTHVLVTMEPPTPAPAVERSWNFTPPAPCPECGPHGNKGRVFLLESWVDCLTCKEAT